MEITPVPASAFACIITGAVLFIALPVIVAIVWKVTKKERMTTILAGALTFLLFAIILEKPIQNVLIFPTAMGLPDHAAARFINARPVLWAILVGLFPGLFEETGRLVAFKTLLRKRKNRETAISHGIGHGGFEVIFILGVTYINNIIYAVMINSGSFQTLIDQVAAKAPEQVEQGYQIAAQLAAFSFGDLAIGLVERVFAVAFHIGASMLVFYACKDRRKFWLYPLAILIHTLMDAIAGLVLAGVITISDWGIEAVCGVIGIGLFLAAYLLLYRKDREVSGKDSGINAA